MSRLDKLHRTAAATAYLLVLCSVSGVVLFCTSLAGHLSWHWLWYLAPAELLLAFAIACYLVLVQRLFNEDGSPRSA